MDFEDFNNRLKRMYAQLGSAHGTDIGNNITDEVRILGYGRFEHRVSFGSADPTIRENIVVGVIHSLAALKDIVKLKLGSLGLNPMFYEELINDNSSLQIITDLDNMNKHGAKLARQRYRERISLTNVGQALRGRGFTEVSFTTNFRDGKTELDSSEGDVSLVIVGNIKNKSGKVVAKLEDVLEEAVELIENFVSAHSLI